MNMLKQLYFGILFLVVTFSFGFTSIKSGSALPEDPKKDWASSDLQSYTNGEMINNAADPFVFRDADGTYFLYHTGKGFPVYTSTDLVNWKSQGKSMLSEGYKWAKGKFWAPEVVKLKNKYYLHYSATGSDGILHIGLATSDSPLGPFTDVNEKPFFETGDKGVLDSDLLFDEGRVYLYYSSAMSTHVVGNQRFSEIWVVEVNPDLSGIKGNPVLLLKPEQKWEYNAHGTHFWNEGTAVFKKNGTYYLMYSANCYCSQNYSLGYATSKSPLGPFVKYERNPVLTNEPYNKIVSGPGHHTITYSPDGKEMIIVYHSHMDVLKGGGRRKINIDRMGIRSDGSIFVNGPTMTLQPAPSSTENSFKDISKEAVIASSSTLPGYKAESLNDGEFSMYQRFKDYEWVGSGKDYVEISFLWKQEQKIDEIWVYNSIDSNRQAIKGFIVSDKGDSIKNITFNKLPGEATIIKFSGMKVAKGFKLYLETEKKRSEIALSEIKIFAKK